MYSTRCYFRGRLLGLPLVQCSLAVSQLIGRAGNNMKGIDAQVLAIVAALLLAIFPSHSQAKAQTASATLTGTIVDPSGASVADATVSLVLSEGRASR